MSIPQASASPDPGPEQRRIVAAWVAEQTERLDPAEQSALDAAQPDWRARATGLIAEGLLAYVVLEMVAPDLAIARASGSHGDGTHAHGDEHHDDALTERLVAHLQDFIDYRDELSERGGLPSGVACAHGHNHDH
jgi:hypothetical protein